MQIELFLSNPEIVYKDIQKSFVNEMNQSVLVNIYDASIFLKTILKEARYRLAQQFIADIFSDPPSVLSSYFVVNIIIGQLEFHRNYLSAINIVFMYYWDIVRRDNIANEISVNLSNSFLIQDSFVKEMIIRADKCMKRIEKEMITISKIIRSANLIIWRYTEELHQITLWTNYSFSQNYSNQVIKIDFL
jgi:hypothetical protein